MSAHGVKNYCKKCQIQFPNGTLYCQHRCAENTNYCQKCACQFKTSDELVDHMKTHFPSATFTS